jgi:transcriptional regulator with XRE-family HTH domain
MLEEYRSAGNLLRDWRQRRRLSQLALAVDAEISQRHLSFLESGRSQPSREMVLRLTERLSVPLRERNMILTAAGFAPIYRERPLNAPELGAARAAIDRILQGHEPHPALAVDRNWTLLSANNAVGVLMAGVADHLVRGEINVLRLSLHPEGLANRILNFREWRAHILARLAHEIEVSAAPRLVALRNELKSYPVPPHALSTRFGSIAEGGIVVPLTLTSEEGPLSFISATTVFGTAVDVTLSEVTIETFFPANPETTKAMAKLTAAFPYSNAP